MNKNDLICPKCAGQMFLLSEVDADLPPNDVHGVDMRHAHSLSHSLAHSLTHHGAYPLAHSFGCCVPQSGVDTDPSGSTSTEYEQALESIEMADREAELIRKAHQLEPVDLAHDQGACSEEGARIRSDEIQSQSPFDRVSKDVYPPATLDGFTLFKKGLKERYPQDKLFSIPAERVNQAGFSAEVIVQRIAYAQERRGRICWVFVTDESCVKNRIADSAQWLELLDGACPTFLVMVVNGSRLVSTPVSEENGIWRCNPRDADRLCVGLRNYLLGVLDSDSVVNNRRDLVVSEFGLVSDPLLVSKILSALHNYRRGIDAIERQKQAMQKAWSDKEAQLQKELIDVIES